ncbi:Ski complex subunit Rec14 [Coemansia sp. Benny D115]|nr:Ski complex subunit Rec14 [Coemansia sp. Benny D115]
MPPALFAPGAIIDQAHDDEIWHTAWVPGKHRLITAGADETTKIWDASTGDCIAELKDGDYAITSLDVNAQGTRLLTSSMDNRMRIWNIGDALETGGSGARPALKIDAGPINAWRSRFVYGAESEPGTASELLASSTDSGTVRLWSPADGSLVRELDTSRPNFLYALAVSPNGTRIACAGAGSSTYVFDIEAGVLLSTFAGHSDNVRSVSFSADSSLLVTASDDKQVQLHDVRHGNTITAFSGHHSWVLSAEMHPNEQYIASGSLDAKVKVWDIGQRKCVESHNQHSQAVWSVAWERSSEDVVVTRPRLVSAGEDCSVRLYDPLLA